METENKTPRDSAEELADSLLNWARHPLNGLKPMRIMDLEEFAERLRRLASCPPPADPDAAKEVLQKTLTPVERGVLNDLIALAEVAWRLADDTEDNGRMLIIDRTNFEELSTALDKLEELPDDQPGVTMGAAAKAEWALRRIFTMESKTTEAPAHFIRVKDSIHGVVAVTKVFPGDVIAEEYTVIEPKEITGGSADGDQR